MKPGDLIRFTGEYTFSRPDSERDFCEGKTGVIVSLCEHQHPNPAAARLYNILLEGVMMEAFDYELGIISEAAQPV